MLKRNLLYNFISLKSTEKLVKCYLVRERNKNSGTAQETGTQLSRLGIRYRQEQRRKNIGKNIRNMSTQLKYRSSY